MRIAVMGAGGVGGYFGARLAQAGHDVAFVARGRHLAAMRERGLTVRSAHGDVRLAQPEVADDAGDARSGRRRPLRRQALGHGNRGGGRPTARSRKAASSFRSRTASRASIGSARSSVAERVMGGVAQIAATIAEPGVIAHTGTMARLRFGPVLPAQQPAAEALLAACKGAGIDAELSTDIRRALWEKFVFLAAFSGLTSVARQPIGVLRVDPDLRVTLEAAMREAWAVGRAQGVALADDFVAQLMTFTDALPAEMKSSMLNDLLAGNRLEAPWLCGAVARMAAAAGIPAPVSATLYAALKPYCAGAPR